MLNRLILIFFTLTFASVVWSQEPDSSGTEINNLNETVDSLGTIETVNPVTTDTTQTTAADSTAGNVDDIVDEFLSTDSLEFQEIQIEFIKKKVIHSPDSAYFNVCKITNTTAETVSGQFRLRVPSDWNIIADPSAEIALAPSETKIFAVRATICADAVGGVAYPVDASLETNDGIFSGAAYVKIPLSSDWDMHVDKHTVYFNEYFDEQEINIYISNKGNAEELVKLHFDIGKLLDVEGLPAEDIYVLMPPYTDSTVTYTVKPSVLTEDERYAYKQIWNESLINIVATSGLGKRFAESIQFTDLESEFKHTRSEKASPLNVDLSVFNLLSSVRPRLNTSIFGQIQFRGDHDLGYIVQARNLFFQVPNFQNYFQAANNATFNINYRWQDKIKAQAGEINNYSIHSLRGWGVKGSYNFDKNNKISVAGITGKFFPLWGVNARYDTRLKKVGLHVGATYEDNDFLFFEAISVQAGANFPIKRNHIFRITLLGTQNVYDQNQGVGAPADTTVLGFSYLASYTGKAGKFRIGLNTRNDQFNFLRIRPGHTASGYARYLINDKSRINATGQFNSIIASPLLFGSFFTGSFNSQQIYRLTYNNRVTNKLSFEVGPTSRILNRVQVDISNTVTSDFDNYFVGVYALTRIRFDQFSILTPTVSAGATLFRDQLATVDTLAPMPTFNLGVSYSARVWGAAANYIYGPNFFLTQGFFDLDVTSFETINLRAHYIRFMNDRRIKFTGYGNYYLRLPSDRQNFALSTRFDFYLPKRWSAYVLGNLFTNSIDTELDGVINSRNFSLNMGVRKSFDLPQPRVKYYRLSVMCFNDINGNGTREETEPLLPNIKVKVAKNLDLAGPDQARFGEQSLVTDPNGELKVIDIPEGNYTMTFESLQNLGNLYNANGNSQEISISENMTLFVPYVESFKVKGKVILERDEYSSLGLINANGIRVTATAVNGEVFSTLTDSEGNYLINIPQGGYYKIKVNNIFGEEFEIDKEEFLIQFNGFKLFNVDFRFFEKKRKVNFGGENFFNFESGRTNGSEDENPSEGEEESEGNDSE